MVINSVLQCVTLNHIYNVLKFIILMQKDKVCEIKSPLFLFFSPNHNPLEIMENIFVMYKKLFTLLRYSVFCISNFPSFFS